MAENDSYLDSSEELLREERAWDSFGASNDFTRRQELNM